MARPCPLRLRAPAPADSCACAALFLQISGTDGVVRVEGCCGRAVWAEMGSATENAAMQLDPLIIGFSDSAPLTDVSRRFFLQTQMDKAALETTEKMTERARLMFLTLPNGPHSSGMPGCRVRATNGTLELVAKVAHTCWTAHKDEIRTMCPQLWDEELLRGWLLMDSLAQRPKAELAARTVGKRAATQVWTANARAKGEVKKARNRAAPEARDEAAEAARKDVFAESYSGLLKDLQNQMEDRPSRPCPPAATPVLPPASPDTPVTVTRPAGEERPAAASPLDLEDCRSLQLEAPDAPPTPLPEPPPPEPPPVLATPADSPDNGLEDMHVLLAAKRFLAELRQPARMDTQGDVRDLLREKDHEWQERYDEMQATMQARVEEARRERDDALKLADQHESNAISRKYAAEMAKARLKEANAKLAARDHTCVSCRMINEGRTVCDLKWCSASQTYIEGSPLAREH